MNLWTGLSLVLVASLGHVTSKPSKQYHPGFMDNINFDGFIGNPNTPERSMMAEERQDAGFSAPSFNIPFQPNFQFNEFGSFLDSNGGFSQFVSGLGGQGLRTQSDFVRQTEQRFTRPQIGGAAIGNPPFKRETGLGQQQFQQHTQHLHQQPQHPQHEQQLHAHNARPFKTPLKRYSTTKNYQRPAQPIRADIETNDSPIRAQPQRQITRQRQDTDINIDYFSPKSFEDSNNFFETAKMNQENPSMNKPAFYDSKVRRTDKHDTSYDHNIKNHKMEPVELEIESREIVDDTSDLKTIFDDHSDFNFGFEPEKYEVFDDSPKVMEKPSFYQPPQRIVASTQSPITKLHGYDRPSMENQFKDFEISRQEEHENENKKQLNIFSDIKSFKNENEESQSNLNKVENLPTFTNFPRRNIDPPKKSFTKKPSFPSFTSFKSKPSVSKTSLVKSKTPFPSFSGFKDSNSQSNPTQKPTPNYPSFTNFKAITTSKPLFTKKPYYAPKKFDYSYKKVTEAPKIKMSPFVDVSSKEISPSYADQETELPHSTTTTVKPYNYEKKNFREPLQQVNKNAGPHQIIRIKTPTRELKPKPKQLSLNDPTHQHSGFKPIIGNINSASYPAIQPTPGKLIIQEVNRRQDTIDPKDVVYDDTQPLITLDTVTSDTGHYRARTRPDNFAINVEASFSPKQENNKPRPSRFQRRIMRLPSTKKFTQILNKRPKSNSADVSSLVLTPKFESSRIVRPSQ